MPKACPDHGLAVCDGLPFSLAKRTLKRLLAPYPGDSSAPESTESVKNLLQAFNMRLLDSMTGLEPIAKDC